MDNSNVLGNKSNDHKFGGKWTVEKLNMFSSYLNLYITALKKQKFKKIYIDAFAGTGSIITTDGEEKIEGSVRLALNAKNKFDKYIFIEKKKEHYDELVDVLKNEFSNMSSSVDIVNEDCNDTLKRICKEVDWRCNRALMLLDPYATNLKWETLECIAGTKAIDVWYLFPLSAVQRMLPRDDSALNPSWKARLTTIFGDDNWEKEFYKKNPQVSLFDEDNNIKSANTDVISKYLVKRLETIFAKVANKPRILYNSNRCPLFLFCFAVSNDSPNAIRLAMRFANYILNMKF